jgi:large subunit ribosomal protein L7e
VSNPNGGFYKRKFLHFIDGGDAGILEHFFNNLVQSMN